MILQAKPLSYFPVLTDVNRYLTLRGPLDDRHRSTAAGMHARITAAAAASAGTAADKHVLEVAHLHLPPELTCLHPPGKRQ